MRAVTAGSAAVESIVGGGGTGATPDFTFVRGEVVGLYPILLVEACWGNSSTKGENKFPPTLQRKGAIFIGRSAHLHTFFKIGACGAAQLVGPSHKQH